MFGQGTAGPAWGELLELSKIPTWKTSVKIRQLPGGEGGQWWGQSTS